MAMAHGAGSIQPDEIILHPKIYRALLRHLGDDDA